MFAWTQSCESNVALKPHETENVNFHLSVLLREALFPYSVESKTHWRHWLRFKFQIGYFKS